VRQREAEKTALVWAVWSVVKSILAGEGSLLFVIEINVQLIGVIAVLFGIAGYKKHSIGMVAKAKTATVHNFKC
jgi:hypothetical protein